MLRKHSFGYSTSTLAWRLNGLLARSSGGNGTEQGGNSASEPVALAAAEAELARLRVELRDAGAF